MSDFFTSKFRHSTPTGFTTLKNIYQPIDFFCDKEPVPGLVSDISTFGGIWSDKIDIDSVKHIYRNDDLGQTNVIQYTKDDSDIFNAKTSSFTNALFSFTALIKDLADSFAIF